MNYALFVKNVELYNIISASVHNIRTEALSLADNPALTLGLELYHAGENAVPGEQFRGLALFRNRSLRENDDLISAGNGSHSVRNQKQR